MASVIYPYPNYYSEEAFQVKKDVNFGSNTKSRYEHDYIIAKGNIH